MIDASIDFFRWKSQAVRDLAWLLLSPSLFKKSQEVDLSDWEVNESILPWLDWLNAQPEAFELFLSQKSSFRLGKYAEHLLLYFLQNFPKVELVASQLQVKSQGKTLGECDFLLRKDQQSWHWELAVKFYLYINNNNVDSLADYVGPNLSDRLDLKYQKLFEQQLLLSQHPQIQLLSQKAWQARSFFKGRIFYPFNVEHQVHPFFSPNHFRGDWIKQSQWNDYLESLSISEAYCLPSKYWLAPIDFSKTRLPKVVDQLKHPLSAPIMCVCFSDGKNLMFEEWRYLFIVPDHWEKDALSFSTQKMIKKN